MAALAEPKAFARWLDRLYRQNWVIYAKRPFADAPRVFRYLGRYSHTHQVAISNYRLIAIENDQVHFHWKDYTDGNRQKTMALAGVEFVRRFLLHVVPSGFVRIRHFGFLAHRHRAEKLELCRRLLNVEQASDKEAGAQPAMNQGTTERAVPPDLCPACKEGRLVVIEKLERQRSKAAIQAVEMSPLTTDTS